ncbi:MAG: HU family DNA-binding protein [Eubacterium sp.]|nr:HU family DNA-binding protein [Eubacterium sp.]
MNKTELVAAIAEQAGITKKDAEAAVKAFVNVVSDELQKKEKVQLIGFGTFSVSERKARTGHNPRNPEESIKIKASFQPKFKAGAALKEKVNSKPAKKAKKK